MHQYRDAMSRALFLANRASSAGDVPVGAVVLDPLGNVIGEGWNVREAHHDPSGHAEIMALRQAGEALKRWNLIGCTLVVTLEPCTMCAGAAVASRVDRVVFGAWEPKTGAAGSLRDVLRDSRMGHSIEVVSGVLASEASAQLSAFFEQCRQREALKDRIPAAEPMPDFEVKKPVVSGGVEDAFAEFAQMAASVTIPVMDNVEWDEEAEAKFGSLPRVPALGDRPRYRSLSTEELKALDEKRREREAREGTRFTLPLPHEVLAVPSQEQVRPSLDPALEERLSGLPEDIRSLIAGIAIRRRER